MFPAATLKGALGESIVLDMLKRLSDTYDLEFIYDFPIAKHDGKFVQCDFVVLSTHGYFVLEVKYWNGTVFCAGFSPTWRLVVGTREIKILNPMLQNQAHKRALSETLQIEFSNILLFADTCHLENAPDGVFNFRELEYLFKANPPVIHPAQVQRDYDTLLDYKRRHALLAIAERYVRMYDGGY